MISMELKHFLIMINQLLLHNQPVFIFSLLLYFQVSFVYILFSLLYALSLPQHLLALILMELYIFLIILIASKIIDLFFLIIQTVFINHIHIGISFLQGKIYNCHHEILFFMNLINSFVKNFFQNNQI